ncbi:HD domain-containing protein [bacterium]|jgi:HD-GYP domain-containing protein (c-di-GMP phosphodiesterase class II)|nr:HD domain-containing protein [bacterium]
MKASRHKSSAKTVTKTAQKQPSEATSAVSVIRGLEEEIARVVHSMHEKVRQLEYMMDFSRLLNSTLDPQVVREKALEATCRLLNCETASLFLIDTKANELYWETALGEIGQELKRSVRLPINDKSIAGYVAMTGEGLQINDVESDPRHFKKPGSSFKTKTMLCVPLRNRGKVIGVLQALNKQDQVPPQPSEHKWASFQAEDFKMLETLSYQVAIAVENSKLYTDLKKSFYETVEALAESIEKKDSYTGGHTKRVVFYSMCIAKYMNLTPEQLETVRLGALLHDVGKIGIEDKILKKDAPLDKDEWKVMQTHPDLGYDIMSRVESLADVMGGMRFHHERWDGKGYPQGLKGEEIPFLARIIAVADTYDAMVSTRPYRKGLPPKTAYDEITRYRGTQFAPDVVDAFIKAFNEGKMGKGSGDTSKHQLSNMD